MGQQKTRLQRMIKAHPFCCFCGGTVETTTVEHAPPKVFFLDKHRPKGLEFPACARCNNGTADSDQIAALITTVMGTVHRPEIEKDHISHLDKLVKGVRNNHPKIIDFLLKSTESDAFEVNGKSKKLSKVVIPDQVFQDWLDPWAAKQGYALWFEHQGKTLEPSSKVLVQWQTNAELQNKTVRDELCRTFPAIGALKQGKWEVNEQYFYTYAFGKEDEHVFGAFMLVLHESCIALVTITTGSLSCVNNGSMFQTTAKKGMHQVF